MLHSCRQSPGLQAGISQPSNIEMFVVVITGPSVKACVGRLMPRKSENARGCNSLDSLQFLRNI